MIGNKLSIAEILEDIYEHYGADGSSLYAADNGSVFGIVLSAASGECHHEEITGSTRIFYFADESKLMIKTGIKMDAVVKSINDQEEIK